MIDQLLVQKLAKKQDDTDRNYWRELPFPKAHTIAIDFTDNARVDGRPGYSWVRLRGDNGGVFQALNGIVPDQPNLPVIVAPYPNHPYSFKILGMDRDYLVLMEGYEGQAFLPSHSGNHEWPDGYPGIDVVTVYPRAYSQLRVQAGTGLTVNVSAYRYYDNTGAYVEWPGELNYDLSAHQPASGLALSVLVYYDPNTQQLGTVAGIAITDIDTIQPTHPDLPTDMLATALVRLDGDQTSFSESDILDVRQLLDNSQIYTTPTIVNAITLDQLALVEAEFDFALTTHVVMG